MVDLRLPSLPGDFPAPRRTRYRLTPETPYPPKPDWYLQSEPQWVCYWWLSQGRRSIGEPTYQPVGPDQPPGPGRNIFFHEIRLPVLGVFARTDEVRIDFYIPGLGGVGYNNLAIDPVNPFTHPEPALDLLKREILAVQADTRLIWIDTARLEMGDTAVIEAALAGRDESNLARTGAP